jgi:TonB family protein
MHVLTLLPLALLSVLPLAAQTPVPASIKDAKTLLAAAAPAYDYDNPDLNPWHFKASYQIYDQNGNPSQRGTYEYWWASPTVYRSTWTRGASTQSEWHTADGKHFETNSGEALHLFETEFPHELLAPLPTASEEDAQRTWLQRDTVTFDSLKAPCVKFLTSRIDRQSPTFPSVIPMDNVKATYCFDPRLPILIMKSRANGPIESYGNFVKMQQRDLPRTFEEKVDRRKILTATIVAMGAMDPSDPALSPPADAKADLNLPLDIASRVMNGQRVKGFYPDYPDEAKLSKIAGTVMIEAQIGKDGKVQNLRVISSPAPVLTDSSVKAVRKWEYKPYLLNGQPIDVRTTIDVAYALAP